MGVENYKNVIIGSGEGGKYLAWHLAQSGQQTIVIERRWIGGFFPQVELLSPQKKNLRAKEGPLVSFGWRVCFFWGGKLTFGRERRSRRLSIPIICWVR